MLIENRQARTVSIGGVGGIHLNPGVNEVDDKKWGILSKGVWKKGIDGSVEEGLLAILGDADKLTIATVKETFCIELLEDWQLNAKGRIKGAIKDQLKTLRD